MDFNDTPEEAKFRQEEQPGWMPMRRRRNTPTRPGPRYWRIKAPQNIVRLSRQYQLKKYEDGWACLHWPKEFGGRGTTPMERVIWGQEEAKYIVPRGVYEIGQGMAGPVLMKYATEEQKQRYLPPDGQGRRNLVPAVQ